MKRIGSFMLSIFLLLGLWGCGGKSQIDAKVKEKVGKYIPGTLSGNTYTSQWLNLEFTLSEGMEFSDPTVNEQYNEIQLKEHPKDYMVWDMSVDYTGTDVIYSPVEVIVRKLTDPEQSLAECVEKEKQTAVSAYESMESEYGIVVYSKWYEPVQVRFSGQDYLLQYSISESYIGWNCNNRVFEYWDLFRIHDSHLIQIRFTSPTYYYKNLGLNNLRLQQYVNMFANKDTDISAFRYKYEGWMTGAGWIGAGFGTLEGSRMRNGETYLTQWKHSDGSTYSLAITIADTSRIDFVLKGSNGSVIDAGYADYRSPGGDVWFQATWNSGATGYYEYRFDPLNLTLKQTSAVGFAGSDQKAGDILYLEKQ